MLQAGRGPGRLGQQRGVWPQQRVSSAEVRPSYGQKHRGGFPLWRSIQKGLTRALWAELGRSWGAAGHRSEVSPQLCPQLSFRKPCPQGLPPHRTPQQKGNVPTSPQRPRPRSRQREQLEESCGVPEGWGSEGAALTRMDRWADRTRLQAPRPPATGHSGSSRPAATVSEGPRLTDLITMPRSGPAAPHVRWDSTP